MLCFSRALPEETRCRADVDLIPGQLVALVTDTESWSESPAIRLASLGAQGKTDGPYLSFIHSCIHIYSHTAVTFQTYHNIYIFLTLKNILNINSEKKPGGFVQKPQQTDR